MQLYRMTVGGFLPLLLVLGWGSDLVTSLFLPGQTFMTSKYYNPGSSETFTQPLSFMAAGTSLKYEILVDEGEKVSLECRFSLPCEFGASVKVSHSGGVHGPKCGTEAVTLTSETQLTLELFSGTPLYLFIYKPSSFSCHIRTAASQDCKCGAGISVMNRIVGGDSARPAELPWSLALYQRGKVEAQCGASVISHYYALTAAHCTHNTFPFNLILFGGSNQLNDPAGTFYGVASVTQHPNYNHQAVLNDIALLRTHTPMRYSLKLSPICLPSKYTGQTFSGAKAIYSGWGTLKEGGQSPNDLQKVDVTVVSNEECLRVMKSRIYSTSICTTSNGKDACQGDSGGPLSVSGHPYDAAYQIGIISFGDGCARPDRYGVNTRVTDYISWIQSNTDVCLK